MRKKINSGFQPDVETSRKFNVLRERAEVLSMIPDPVSERGVAMNCIGFLLSDELYLIETVFLLEVIYLNEITPLPCCPPYILGIINVRGRIISIINLKNFLNLPDKGITNFNRVIVVEHNGIEVGLLVDDVVESTTVFKDQLIPLISTLTAKQKEYLLGVTIDHAIVFNLEKFLSDEKIIINEEV